MDIKAQEEIMLILNTRVTAVSRIVQDIDSGENSSTVCFCIVVGTVSLSQITCHEFIKEIVRF